MNYLELGWDGFFNFDPYPEIFEFSAKKTLNFQIWRQNYKMVFGGKNAI